MFKYEILVKYDAFTATNSEIETYSRVADKYNALRIGHEKTGTSSMLLKTEECLNLAELNKDLGSIKIVRVNIY